MREVALGITATIALLMAAVLLVVVTGWVPRGPMDHGWDWPWHDWWHSRLEYGRLHQYGPTMTMLRDVQFLGGSGAVERWQSVTHLGAKP